MKKTIRVLFPNRLTTSAALNFGRLLRALPDADIYEIDFSRCVWIEPFSALIASSEITRLKQGVRGLIKPIRFEHMSYAAQIGFFVSFGLNFGNGIEGSGGGLNYLPIHFLHSDRVRQQSKDEGIAVGEVMEGYAERMSGVLCRCSEGVLYDTLTYSIREIMRNVVEHSSADRLAYCAQYWPAKERVEVAIMDWGVGIRRGLSENPKIKLESDQHALHMALLPGVSGKAEKVKKMRGRDQWRNSGFGLYMTSRLCRSGGSFIIGSGQSALLLSGNDVLPMAWGLNGTAIRLNMDVSSLPGLDSQLELFRKEAHLFRANVKNIDFLTASMASRALMRDLTSS